MQEKPFVQPSYSDKKLEVIGLRNSLHMGQIQVALADPVRLCQGADRCRACVEQRAGSELVLRSKAAISLHVDGEPWQQTVKRCALCCCRVLACCLLRSGRCRRLAVHCIVGILLQHLLITVFACRTLGRFV